MKTLFLVSCLLVSALAFDLDAEWQKWKAEHGKLYGVEHDEARKQIFGDNLKFIKEHNQLYAEGKKSYRVALNQFADMTRDEFNKQRKGYNQSKRIQNRAQNNVFKFNASNIIAAHVDWREKNVVTPVKDQGSCGSCWAFSTTGSIEAQHAIKTGKLVSLSEQNLVDCETEDNGCNGGLMDNAFTYIHQNGGIDTEESYPYKAVDGRCKFNKTAVGAKIFGFVDVDHNDEKALAQAVHDIGPVSIAIWADFDGFRFYESGVLDATDYDCPEGQLDHGVLAVGYGTLKGKDYWLVKNSWGASWGQNGYILMSRNKNNQCGVAQAASFPVAETD